MLCYFYHIISYLWGNSVSHFLFRFAVRVTVSSISDSVCEDFALDGLEQFISEVKNIVFPIDPADEEPYNGDDLAAVPLEPGEAFQMDMSDMLSEDEVDQ